MSIITRSDSNFRLSVHATPGARKKIGGEHFVITDAAEDIVERVAKLAAGG